MSFVEWLAGGSGFAIIVFLAGFLYGCYVTEREQERLNRHPGLKR